MWIVESIRLKIFSTLFNLFSMYVFLVFVLKSTPNQTPLNKGVCDWIKFTCLMCVGHMIVCMKCN